MTPPGLARVLVALGAASQNRRVVETGVGLAAAVGAALDALFVEDVNLLRLGALPFASEISMLTGARRTLAGGEMERALRVEATRLEHQLAAAATPRGVPWSFAVTKGELLAEAMTREADLIVLGTSMRSAAPAVEHGSPGPVTALFDATPDAVRALAATARLARALARGLVVLVPEGASGAGSAARQQARAWLATEQVEGLVLPLDSADSALADVVRARRSRMLALPASVLSERHLRLATLLAELTCPVVIVR